MKNKEILYLMGIVCLFSTCSPAKMITLSNPDFTNKDETSYPLASVAGHGQMATEFVQKKDTTTKRVEKKPNEIQDRILKLEKELLEIKEIQTNISGVRKEQPLTELQNGKQTGSNFNHKKGEKPSQEKLPIIEKQIRKAISLMPLYNSNGYGLDLAITKIRPRSSYSLFISPLMGKIKHTSNYRLMVGLRPQYTIWNYRQRFCFSAFCSASAGFEYLDNQILSMSDHKPVITFGVGPELEIHLTRRVSVVGQFQQEYNLLTPVGDYSYCTRLGFRYIF